MALDNTATLQELPDLVKHEVLRRLPTKVVVNISFLSKQLEDILSSSLALDFDESGGKYKHPNLQRHETFINVLKKSLLIFQTRKQDRDLDTFRLCMTNFECRDDVMIVSEWLSYSLTRSVKKIDISLKSQHWSEIRNRSCITMMNFVNASRSLTSLNLEYVILGNIKNRRNGTDAPLFPSLKKMSFKNVFFDSNAFYDLLLESPAVESLSFISCSFDNHIYVKSLTLKFLVIKDCDNVINAAIRSTLNLESVRVVSNKDLRTLELRECYNLKNINVSGNGRLESFHVEGFNDHADGTIRAPRLKFFSYRGYLNSRFSVKAPKLRLVSIQMWDNWGGVASFDPLKHFPKLKDFLGTFGNSAAHVKLIVSDYKTLVFPEDFRRTVETDIAWCQICGIRNENDYSKRKSTKVDGIIEMDGTFSNKCLSIKVQQKNRHVYGTVIVRRPQGFKNLN